MFIVAARRVISNRNRSKSGETWTKQQLPHSFVTAETGTRVTKEQVPNEPPETCLQLWLSVHTGCILMQSLSHWPSFPAGMQGKAGGDQFAVC